MEKKSKNSGLLYNLMIVPEIFLVLGIALKWAIEDWYRAFKERRKRAP